MNNTPIDIWEGTPCKAKVKLTPYLAHNKEGIGCIVCPGGSYFWLARKTEGHEVAKWLQANGISAFVLEYRVGGIPAFITRYRWLLKGNRFPGMLHDVFRAIDIIREKAIKFDVNPNRIGVMGFSAGGHLALMSGILYDSPSINFNCKNTHYSLRPDFIASIYPVVSLTHKCAHKRSRRGLLGEKQLQDKSLRENLSIERNVHPQMPPVFLMNCKDDPTVNSHNSVLLATELKKKGVPHTFLQYETGGHGFGTTDSKTSGGASNWKYNFLNWVRELCMH